MRTNPTLMVYEVLHPEPDRVGMYVIYSLRAWVKLLHSRLPNNVPGG